MYIHVYMDYLNAVHIPVHVYTDINCLKCTHGKYMYLLNIPTTSYFWWVKRGDWGIHVAIQTIVHVCMYMSSHISCL